MTPLEILAGSISAAFGILGIVTETKGNDGRLTRWGMWNLVLFITAGLLTVVQRVITTIEESATRYESQVTTGQTLNLLSLQLRSIARTTAEVRRGMNLVPSTFDVRVSLSIPCAALPPNLVALCKSGGGFFKSITPSEQEALLSFLGVKGPRAGRVSIAFSRPETSAGNDLVLLAFLNPRSEQAEYYFFANAEQTTLTVATSHHTLASVTNASGRIASLEDLSGSRVSVNFSSPQCNTVARSESVDPSVRCVARKLDFRTPSGRRFEIDGFAPLRGGYASVATVPRNLFPNRLQ